MLRAHAALTKALDADLDAAHGLPLSSYEVLLYLNDADGPAHAHARPRGVGHPQPLAASRAWPTASSARASSAASRAPSDARGAYAVLTPAGAEMLAAARTTHLAGVRSLFLQHFSDDELEVLGDAWDRVVPGSASAPGPPAASAAAAARSSRSADGSYTKQRLGIRAVPSA